MSAVPATNSWFCWEPRTPLLLPMRTEDPKFVAALRELEVELRPASSLSELTSLSIGGNTDLLRIKKHESIPALLSLLDAHGVPHRFLGGGSNLLVGDGELPWVVLQLASPDPDEVLEGNFARVDAAADLGRTVTYCAKHDLGGMEGLIGRPGTLGGALAMKAGPSGRATRQFFRDRRQSERQGHAHVDRGRARARALGVSC